MGQFKPMVKMETTEPSVELKLKKGGKVAKMVKKADGGMMGSPMSAAGAMPPAMPARGGMPMAGSPMKPSLAMRRRAMRGMPAGAGPAGPVGGAASMQPAMPMSAPPMKKGGMAKGGESKATHMAEMSKMKGLAKELKSHENKPASKGHKGLATGGVVNGQGGYKKGGKVKMAKGGVAGDGIINTEGQGGAYRDTMMHTSKPDKSPAKTGGVKMGNGGGYATGGVTKSNAGGYKKGGKIPKKADGGLMGVLGGMTPRIDTGGSYGGSDGSAMSGLGSVNQGASTIGSALKNISNSVGSGMKRGGAASKKAYAAGGTVNSGRPVAMPQGRKPAPKPVAINELAGTYKKGGRVAPGNRALQSVFNKENATAMRQAKAMTNEKYGPASKMKLAQGGDVDLSKGAYDKSIGPDADDMAMARSIRGFPSKVMGKVKSAAKDLFSTAPKADSVTKTKESVTVTPAKKRGGMVNC
jgi:hypothetical protein